LLEVTLNTTKQTNQWVLIVLLYSMICTTC
jgi:hypothetical protein